MLNSLTLYGSMGPQVMNRDGSMRGSCGSIIHANGETRGKKEGAGGPEVRWLSAS